MHTVDVWVTNGDCKHLMTGNYEENHRFAMKVWIYNGMTTSDLYRDYFTVPSVLVIHEHQHHFDAKFMFFFQDEWITMTDQVSKKAARFYSGTTKDSRGFEVDWQFHVSGDEIRGTYQMEYDNGSCQLNLTSLQKSEPARAKKVRAVI